MKTFVKKFIFLLLLCVLLLSGCTKEESMYLDLFELADEDINEMLTRSNLGGIFEYNIDNIKKISIEGVKYEQNKDPDTFLNYQTVSDSGFLKAKSKFIFQLSKKTGSILLLTEGATSDIIYDEIPSLKLSSVVLREKTEIEPNVSIPFLVMAGPSSSETIMYNLEFYMINPEVIQEYDYIIIFSIKFHSSLT